MPDAPPESVLRFDRVTVSFDGVLALRDISFEVLKGQARIILGAASSGKTVLLKTAMGLNPVEKGSIFVFGRDISRLTEREMFEVRSQLGMLFQESALFDSLTIEENVAYPLLNQKAIQCPLSEVQGRVEEALRFVELGQTLRRFPSELSGGMRRRAAIARAVVSRPALLLYDSPTAGLDPITAYTIMALIVKERDLANTTTLIVTHRYQDGNLVANFRYNPENGKLEPARESEQKLRTKFLVMRDGQIIFEGGQAELEAQSDPYIVKFRKLQGG